jgi:hypothetical protein
VGCASTVKYCYVRIFFTDDVLCGRGHQSGGAFLNVCNESDGRIASLLCPFARVIFCKRWRFILLDWANLIGIVGFSHLFEKVEGVTKLLDSVELLDVLLLLVHLFY